MKQPIKQLMKLAAIVFLFAGIIPLSKAQENEKGFIAFKTYVHPVLLKNCASCHSEAGPGPAHSVMDPLKSYQAIRRYITNFSDLKSSKLVTAGTREDMAGREATQELINALKQWGEAGEGTALLADKKVLSSQKIPKLPGDESFVTMKWDLGEADPELKGVTFSVSIQMMNGAYRLKNPEFSKMGADQAIKVQGLYVVMNGVLSQAANNYENVNDVFTEVNGSSVLSTMRQIIIDGKGAGQDDIAFAFQKIARAPMPSHDVLSANPHKIKQDLANTRSGRVLDVFDGNKVGKAAQFVRIEASPEKPIVFEMGSTDKNGYNENLHYVKLTHSFEMQATDVTELQWYQVMKEVPSYFKDKCDEGSTPNAGDALPPMCKHHPVEQVSWIDVQKFISKLNAIQGLQCGDTSTDAGFNQAAMTPGCYRLPTEAEWEYIAHAGLPSEYAYGFGSDFDGQYAWYSGNSNNKTHAVATKLPTSSPQNEEDFVYDMAGNVWQWVQDWYGDYQKGDDPRNAVLDPRGATSGSLRVLRGGAFSFGPLSLRSAQRFYYDAGYRNYNFGFRLVRTP